MQVSDILAYNALLKTKLRRLITYILTAIYIIFQTTKPVIQSNLDVRNIPIINQIPILSPFCLSVPLL